MRGCMAFFSFHSSAFASAPTKLCCHSSHNHLWIYCSIFASVACCTCLFWFSFMISLHISHFGHHVLVQSPTNTDLVIGRNLATLIPPNAFWKIEKKKVKNKMCVTMMISRYEHDRVSYGITWGNQNMRSVKHHRAETSDEWMWIVCNILFV